MTPPKRQQSQTDRDMQGMAAKREREAAPQEFSDEEDSMAHEVEDRAQIRAKRSTDERIGRLEEKHDALHSTVTDTRVMVAEMSGKLDALPQLVSMLQADKQDALDARKHARERITKVVAGVFSAGVLGAILHAVVS